MLPRKGSYSSKSDLHAFYRSFVRKMRLLSDNALFENVHFFIWPTLVCQKKLQTAQRHDVWNIRNVSWWHGVSFNYWDKKFRNQIHRYGAHNFLQCYGYEHPPLFYLTHITYMISLTKNSYQKWSISIYYKMVVTRWPRWYKPLDSSSIQMVWETVLFGMVWGLNWF